MPRKKRTTKKRSDAELYRLLSNPFTLLNYKTEHGEFCHPLEDPGFDKNAAYRLWRQKREEIWERWRQRWPPGTQPPGATLFDNNPKRKKGD
jgi:hypothetical protein